MSDAPEGNETQIAADVPSEGVGNYRQRAVMEMSKPAPAPKEYESKKERRAREAQEAVADLKARAAVDHAVVLAAQEAFGNVEREARKEGRACAFPYTPERAEQVLRSVEKAIPLDDYSEFPGAAERPGACTLAGVPHWAFRCWIRGQQGATKEEGISLHSALARARMVAADNLADRHLHLAQVALEQPRASDAVRVAAEILKWQAQIRNRGEYGDQTVQKTPAQQVTIIIAPPAAQPAAKPEPRVIDGEVVTVPSQVVLQVPDATG